MDRPVRNNVILQVRTNRASTSWCRTEARYFLFLREREREIGKDANRIRKNRFGD